ncbi:hypothetical protein NADFUDRAFT_51186 [Nadsonia fulvescens var. elongata DSM 6958]|uniref:COPI associated n=1 Tax=Nadsonia fulvescens var. elongata DSM 6958 TaxID=857566 RepID=A0A1E3PKT6_9ASCO|nr:hypothetical protein NADFUDRAFT_51186 [Nadsonia fulvescens var. elongata DSM 6958]
MDWAGCDLTYIFKLSNIIVGACTALGGILSFFPISLSSLIISIYTILFAAIILALEIHPAPPITIQTYFSFLYSFLGRGVFYVFIGALLLLQDGPGYVLKAIASWLILAIGGVYAVLEFIPSVQKPENMVIDSLGFDDIETV